MFIFIRIYSHEKLQVHHEIWSLCNLFWNLYVFKKRLFSPANISLRRQVLRVASLIIFISYCPIFSFYFELCQLCQDKFRLLFAQVQHIVTETRDKIMQYKTKMADEADLRRRLASLEESVELHDHMKRQVTECRRRLWLCIHKTSRVGPAWSLFFLFSLPGLGRVRDVQAEDGGLAALHRGPAYPESGFHEQRGTAF